MVRGLATFREQFAGWEDRYVLIGGTAVEAALGQAPKDVSFPSQLEFFSRRPDGLTLPVDAELTPLPISDELSSLSAILLDDDYYAFVCAGVIQVEGLAILMPEHLIPLKACAWVDLTAKRDAGEKIDSRDIKKHRSDIVRLYQVIVPATRVELPETLATGVSAFLETAFNDDFEPKHLGILATTAEVTSALRVTYGLDAARTERTAP